MVWSAITWICSNKGVIEKGRRSCESWLDKAAKTLFFQANEAVVWGCAAECRGWRSMEEVERPWTWFVIQSESLGGPQRRETSSPYVCFVCIWKLQGWRLGDEEEEEGHTALCIIRFEGMCGSCCCVFLFCFTQLSRFFFFFRRKETATVSGKILKMRGSKLISPHFDCYNSKSWGWKCVVRKLQWKSQ